MIKLVVIDFDDTLSLTEKAYFKVENHIAEKIESPPMTREAHQKNWGMPLKKAIVERIPGIDADTFMEIHSQVLPGFFERNEVDTISEKNIKTLKKLKEDGKYLVILTSRTFNEVKHLLNKNHHLNKYIEKIYHMDNMDFHKPDPRAFNQPLKDFLVTPEETVYIGDSLGDGISAKGAGIHFIALLESGLRTKKDFDSVSVDFFAKKFPDIIDYIYIQPTPTFF
jgi:HAD superfamily hydrolase (TIGR01549 family)